MEAPVEVGGQTFLMLLTYKIVSCFLSQYPYAWLLEQERIIIA